MNKELTAMQMLFDLIDSEVVRLSRVKGEHKKASEQCANQLVILKMKAKNMQLLEKEQYQIEKAYEDGFDDGIESELGYRTKYESQTDYYQSKYRKGNNEF